MSHFTVLKTKFVDAGALVKALADLGFKKVESHKTAQPLYGYLGDRRADTAEIIIRRNYVGQASNDLGFRLSEDGSYTAVISEFDRASYNEPWLNRLSHRYAYHATTETLKEQGFGIVQEEVQGGKIHMVLRRMV